MLYFFVFGPVKGEPELSGTSAESCLCFTILPSKQSIKLLLLQKDSGFAIQNLSLGGGGKSTQKFNCFNRVYAVYGRWALVHVGLSFPLFDFLWVLY